MFPVTLGETQSGRDYNSDFLLLMIPAVDLTVYHKEEITSLSNLL